MQMDESGAMREMPRYQSHKKVWALKIAAITPAPDGAALLTFEDHNYVPQVVPKTYLAKHDPKPGGYYVVYEDGYASWSPASAFETGYTRIG